MELQRTNRSLTRVPSQGGSESLTRFLAQVWLAGQGQVHPGQPADPDPAAGYWAPPPYRGGGMRAGTGAQTQVTGQAAT